MRALLLLLSSYLCGSVPTGLWLGRVAGIDVRAAGSGNIGATNVARTAGAWLGLITLAVDISKGFLPVIVARSISESALLPALAAVAAFLGHIFSIFARFRGGKGVATAAGAFLALSPAVLGGAAAVFAFTAWRSRIVSLASLAGSAALPLFSLVFGAPAAVSCAAAVMAVVIAATHRENIRRLRAGTEPRFSARGPGRQAAG
jgi:glycerol-3-phosphate acyltransferase PlsY